MILEEGGGKIEDTTLFGKYQLCRVLGTGRAGTVYQAIHLGLEEYRAIKRVPKSFVDYERFRREALILKELRHPGIPIVYDLEEDQDFSYLIEEYLEGESLYALIKEEGPLPGRLVVHYGIAICRIMTYLHSAGTTPILHLDLQPKNLLLCHDTIKLIDFDHAASIADANRQDKRYGTLGCAAPEQHAGHALDTRTDVYAIGALLHYMGTGAYPGETLGPWREPWGKELAAIISSCLHPDRSLRIQSAAHVGERLERLADVGAGVFAHGQSSLMIALIGSKPGAGTTHLSIGLSVHLKNQGYPNLYEEKNPSGAANRLGACLGKSMDSYGCMKHGGFVWKPYFGECVKLEESPFQVRIRDYGTDLGQVAEDRPAAIVLVSGGKWWDAPAGREALSAFGKASGIPLCLVYNQTISSQKVERPPFVEPKQCLRAPWFGDPFAKSPETEAFYQSLLERLGMEMGVKRKRKLGKSRMRLALRKITGPSG